MGLSKGDFIARVNARVAGRYGEPIGEVWLKDRIKDDLVDVLKRKANSGTSPQFFATARHYRRALQIKRIEASGIKSRDAILLQLFVRGYGIPAAVVGNAVERELRRSLKLLRCQLTSNYFFGVRDRGPKFESIISRQMGEIYNIFAHLELPVGNYFRMARGFYQNEFEGNPNFLKGILASGLPFVENVERCSPEEIKLAAEMLSNVEHLLLRPMFGDVILGSREFVAVLLGVFLWFGRQQISVEQLLGWIDNPAAFEPVIAEFADRVRRLAQK